MIPLYEPKKKKKLFEDEEDFFEDENWMAYMEEEFPEEI